MNDEDNVIEPMFYMAAGQIFWARRKIDRLAQYQERYLKECVRLSVDEPTDDDPFYTVIYESDESDPYIPFEVGDIIRNLRASLDYATSAIFRSNDEQERSAYYPIRNDTSDLLKYLQTPLLMRGLGAFQELFERELGASSERKPKVWSLHQIDIANRHRAINVVAQLLARSLPNYTATNDLGGSVTWESCLVGLSPGQPHVQRVPGNAVFRGPIGDYKSFQLQFGRDETFANEGVVPILNDLSNEVGDVLTKLSQHHRKIQAAGDT